MAEQDKTFLESLTDKEKWGVSESVDPIADSIAAVEKVTGMNINPPTVSPRMANPIPVEPPSQDQQEETGLQVEDIEGASVIGAPGHTRDEHPLWDPTAPKMLNTYDSDDDLPAGFVDKYVEVSATDSTPGNIVAKLVGEETSERVPVKFVTNGGADTNQTRGLYIDKDDLPDPETVLGNVFPVVLTQYGGSQGTDSTAASWTYTVKDINGNTLGTDVNPAAGVHNWTRPTVGQMRKATAGYAHYIAGPTLVIGWTNEVAEQEAC